MLAVISYEAVTRKCPLDLRFDLDLRNIGGVSRYCVQSISLPQIPYPASFVVTPGSEIKTIGRKTRTENRFGMASSASLLSPDRRSKTRQGNLKHEAAKTLVLQGRRSTRAFIDPYYDLLVGATLHWSPHPIISWSYQSWQLPSTFLMDSKRTIQMAFKFSIDISVYTPESCCSVSRSSSQLVAYV